MFDCVLSRPSISCSEVTSIILSTNLDTVISSSLECHMLYEHTVELYVYTPDWLQSKELFQLGNLIWISKYSFSSKVGPGVESQLDILHSLANYD